MKIVERGGAVEAVPSSDISIYPIIGLDFGTSCTKAIVRLFGEAEDPVFAVEVPSWCRAENHPYLWRTYLAYDERGAFTPWFDEGSNSITGLKTGVLFEKPNALAGSSKTRRPMYLEAMVAHLAIVIRYIRGWMLTQHSRTFAGKVPHWSVNLGLPAENADNSELVIHYRRAAVAALMLADTGAAITLDSCNAAFGSEAAAALAKDESQAQERGISVIPEVAAEVAGWAQTTQRRDGLYAMIDVGAATLDICTFLIARNQSGSDRYSILMGQVGPLGTEATQWFSSAGRTIEEFKYQCEWQQNRVIWQTRRNRADMARCWEKAERFPAFLCGGGARSPIHREVVEKLDPWLKKFVDNAGLNLLEMEKPSRLALRGVENDFSRLAVAWGLSYPPFAIGEIELPRAIDDVSMPKRQYEVNFVSKDQV